MANQNSKKIPDFGKHLGWLFLICGIIGLLAATILANDYVTSLKNPTYQPVCDLNPIFSCSNVMDSHQAHAFGIPNEFIGIAGFAAVTAAGVALLAGAKVARWAWRLFYAGIAFVALFVTWLQFETIYRIGALCIFCMIVWSVIIPLTVYTKLYMLQSGGIRTPKRLSGLVQFSYRYHAEITASWYLLIIALILKRFWYYWSTL